ncbi:MAG: inner membrane CreD family protein [Treponema sp.]|nr:inner membrane CreD family protein [Treponema sp.]
MENQNLKKISGIGIKILFIALIIIGLLIGLACIKGQLTERERSYKSAKWDISNSAGGTLSFKGPFIAVPYTKTWNEFVYKDGKQFTETKKESGYEFVNADYVNIDAQLDSEIRTVGIYSNPIFTGTSDVYASFNWQKPNKKDTTYDLENAIVYFSIQNSSLTNSPVFNVNNKDYETDLYFIGEKWVLGAKVPVASQKMILKTKIGIRGAEKFSYNICSKDTKLTLKSDWKSPGFTGFSYLPDKHTIDENGFNAIWNVHFGSTDIAQNIGVSFIEPVNLYQKLHRATKYGFLFIIVPFLVLFLFEIFAKITLHPVNYMLSGIACILFFLLLLALSEHIPFDVSYLTGAVTAGITVSLYISSVTKKFKLGLIMTLIFAILYAYLFLSLKSEDYALLFGAFFAFAITAFIMFITRKIDWYNLKNKQLPKKTQEA